MIWLAIFENQSQLTDYIDWKYLEDADDPKCTFSDDIGLRYFDSDFIETIFVMPPSNILEQIANISFAENFKIQLLTKIKSTNYSDKNCIISLTGKKDAYGAINGTLFDFTPNLSEKKYLQFIGVFKYEET
jgi:Immunity protein 22